jgi:hypothetical protein
MKPELRHVGEARSPVVVIDDFSGAVDEAVELAATMAPFPSSSGSYYPGLRRPIATGDAAYGYVERLLRGTAFFRQRATGIELVDDRNVEHFVTTARRVNGDLSGYTHGSNQHYEQIGQVEGVRDRLAIYRGSMLHSGIIPPDMAFSADPRLGRLTANIFIKGAEDDRFHLASSQRKLGSQAALRLRLRPQLSLG